MNSGLNELVKRGFANAEGSSRSTPSLWDQMEQVGVTANYTKNLTIEGNTVHMRRPTPNTISKEKLGAALANLKTKPN